MIVLPYRIFNRATNTAAEVQAGGNGKEKLPSAREKGPVGCDVGTSNLGITVLTDAGEPVANESTVVIKSKTGETVFTGTTDNAGQIDVTLPQGDYTVVVQDQSKKVKLDSDEDISFTVKSPDLPKT